MVLSKIIGNLDEYKNIKENSELCNLISKLNSFDINELFYFEDPLNTKYSEIQSIIHEIDKFFYKNIESEINEKMVSIVKSAIRLFRYSLIHQDLKKFIIFSYINTALDMDIDFLVKNFQINEELEMIFKKVACLFDNTKIRAYSNIDNYEKSSPVIKKAMLIDFNKKMDVMNNPLKLLNMEQNSYLFHHFKVYTPRLLCGLIRTFKDNDFELFTETLLNQENLLIVGLFVKELTNNEIISIYSLNNINNINVLFVFLKRFLDSDDAHFKCIIKDIMSDFLEFDLELFKKLIHLFKANTLFNCSMGLLVSSKDLPDISIIINEFGLNLHPYKGLLDVRKCFLDNVDKSSKNYWKLLETIYLNWNDELNSILEENDESFDLLCSDFYHFILRYYFEYYTDEIIIMEMELNFNKLNEIGSEWAKNITNYKNKIHVYFTKIFILSQIYKLKKIYNKRIEINYLNLKSNRFLLEILLNKNAKEILSELEQNILNFNRFN